MSSWTRRSIVALLVVTAFAAPLGLSTPSSAGVPDPTTSVVQNVLIGSWTGTPIFTSIQPCGPKHPELFQVQVRDIANLPVPGAVIKVFFAGTGVRQYSVQNANITNYCSAAELSSVADANGIAQFSVRMGGHVEAPSIQVTANGILLASVPGRSPDYDGDGRVSLADVNVFAADYLDPLSGHPRSDFDNCPSSTLADLNFFVKEYAASSPQPAATLCP